MFSKFYHNRLVFRYFVFYSPFDLVYKLLHFFPIKLVVSLAKEVQRTHKVHHAVTHAAKLYPNSYLVMVLIGAVKGGSMGLLFVLISYVCLHPRYFLPTCNPKTLFWLVVFFSLAPPPPPAPHFFCSHRSWCLAKFPSAPGEEVQAASLLTVLYSCTLQILNEHEQSYCALISLLSSGAGAGIMRTLEQLVRGVWVPTSNEFLRPSLLVFVRSDFIVLILLYTTEWRGLFVTCVCSSFFYALHTNAII